MLTLLLDCPSLTLRAITKGSEPNEYKQFDEVQFFHPVISLLLDKFPTLLNKLQVKEMIITGFNHMIFPFNGFHGVAHFVAIPL